MSKLFHKRKSQKPNTKKNEQKPNTQTPNSNLPLLITITNLQTPLSNHHKPNKKSNFFTNFFTNSEHHRPPSTIIHTLCKTYPHVQKLHSKSLKSLLTPRTVQRIMVVDEANAHITSSRFLAPLIYLFAIKTGI